MTKVFGKPSTEGLPYSKSVKAGNSIHISGLTACDEAGNTVGETIGDQTEQIIAQAKAELGYYDAKLSDIVKVVVYLPNMDDYEAFNDVYATYFHSDAPARTTISAQIPTDGFVEIDFTAYQAD